MRRNHEASLVVQRARTRPVVCEPQEVPGLRLRTLRLEWRAIEFDETNLQRMEFQPETLNALGERPIDPLRIRFAFTDDHEIVRVSDQKGAASDLRSDRSFKPHVERVMEENVAQLRRDHAPLGRATRR